MKLTTLMICMIGLLATRSATASPLTFTLDSVFLTTTPGLDVTFDATLTNPTATTEFLNGDSFTSALAVDDTPFFVNFPLSLAPGASFHAAIFTILVPASTLPGLYAGIFDILGGADPLALDVLATRTFTVNVTPAATAVPEPATLSLLLTASLASGAIRAIRKRGYCAAALRRCAT
jgi:hypothetical protein